MQERESTLRSEIHELSERIRILCDDFEMNTGLLIAKIDLVKENYQLGKHINIIDLYFK